MKKIVLSGWHGGGENGMFGLRVSVKDRELFRGLTRVKVELTDLRGESRRIEIELSDSFWRKCPELRSRGISQWMSERGDCYPHKRTPWPEGKGHPPKYKAEIKGNHLRVIA